MDYGPHITTYIGFVYCVNYLSLCINNTVYAISDCITIPNKYAWNILQDNNIISVYGPII